MSRWAFTIRLYSPSAYCGRLAVVAAHKKHIRPTVEEVK